MMLRHWGGVQGNNGDVTDVTLLVVVQATNSDVTVLCVVQGTSGDVTVLNPDF